MTKKIIKLTEKDIHNIIKECISNYKGSILTEDRESKNMKRARNVVRKFQPNADAVQIITAIRNDIPNSRINQCEYLAGVTRMYMNGELNDGRKISQLNALLKILGNAHATEYDNDLNGMSAEDLIKRFSTEVANDLQTDIDAHNQEQFVINEEYDIIRIESTEEAWPYNKYTDWCITSSEPGENYNEDDWTDDDGYVDEDYFDPHEAPDQTSGYDMYQSYTNGGLGVFYFVLKRGFENIPPQKGEGCPLDEYGLSMIATSIDENGKCNTITCRWNHDNGGNDEIMTPMQLSKLIGRNYYEVFKPYTKEERMSKGIMTFDEVEQVLASGVSWRKIFKKSKSCTNGLIIVEINAKQNYYNPETNQLLSKQWFNEAGNFGDGLAPVSLEYGKSNYIKEDGTFLFDDWINGVAYPFYNGTAKIKIFGQDGGYYLIDADGNYTNSKALNHGYDKIIRVGNFISTKNYSNVHLYTTDGDRLFENLDINRISDCGNGYVEICVNAKIKEEQDWYRYDKPEYETEYGLVQPDGTLFLGQLFDSLSKVGNYVRITNKTEDNRKIGFFNVNGNFITNTWYDDADYLYKGTDPIKVVLNNQVNYLDCQQEKLLLKQWAENGTITGGGSVAIQLSGKWYLLNDNMKPIMNNYFDSITRLDNKSFSRGVLPAKVEKNGKFTIVDKNGRIFPQWFDEVSYFFGHKIGVIDGKRYVINTDTQQISREYTAKEYAKDKEEDDWLRWERRQENI